MARVERNLPKNRAKNTANLLEISAIFLPLIEQDLQKFQLFNERKTGYLRAKFDERLRKIYANFVEILAIFLGAL